VEARPGSKGKRRVPKPEVDRRVKEVAQMLGIGGLLMRKPKQLSGGQRQRVAMGRAIVRKPQAFLFDEPLSNLDAKLRVQMRGELAKLHEKLETTIIYVTHDQIEAMTLADRIVVMDNGVIMQVGSPLEVYHHPRNLFVVGFMGSPGMNFFDLRVVGEKDSLSLEWQNFKLPIPEALKERFEKARGRDVILGIRSEHVHDKRTKTYFPGAGTLKATVEVVEPIGSEVILIASCGCENIAARVDSQTDVRPHMPVEFLVDMNRMHLFDRVTEESYWKAAARVWKDSARDIQTA